MNVGKILGFLWVVAVVGFSPCLPAGRFCEKVEGEMGCGINQTKNKYTWYDCLLKIAKRSKLTKLLINLILEKVLEI